MKSLTQLSNLFNTYTQNSSTTNTALGKQLINDAHRYLLQKFFNNEGSFSIATFGGSTYTLTGSLSSGAISATLSSAWTGLGVTKLQVTFSNDDIRMVNFINGSTVLTWDVGLTATATTAITVGGQQFYPLPPNYSKLKSMTITNGNLTWTPVEILTQIEWNRLNVFPYYSDIPNNFYIFPGGDHGAQIGIWPIPSTTNNTITFQYKYRVPDLSIADYTTPGSISITTKTSAVTGSATSFAVTTNQQLEARWIQFSPTGVAATAGDNLWYQIATVSSTTALTLYQPYQGTTVTASSNYTIGQMPLINEDFHDLMVYWALVRYFSTIQKDLDKANLFKELYEEGEARLAIYCGSNTMDVNLGRRPFMANPNLYNQSFGQ